MSEDTPSGYDTPLTAMFEMQRTAIEVGHAVLEESLAAQREATAHVREIAHTQEALQRQTLALSWAGVHDSLTLVTGSVPGRTHAIDGARQSVDETDADHASRIGDVDGAADESSSTIEVLTDVAAAPDELAEDGVESSIGAAETLTEPSTEVAETVAESSPSSNGEDEHTDRLERVHGIGDAHRQHLGEVGIETLQDLAAAEVDAVVDATGVTTERASEWVDRASALEPGDVDSISGIGEAHAEALHEGGIETVADLAAAESEAVSTTAEVSEDHAREWTDEAQRRQEARLETIDGIGETRAARLCEGDIETVADLAVADSEHVAELTDVDAERADTWIQAAQH